MAMDGHKLTLKLPADNLDTLHQVYSSQPLLAHVALSTWMTTSCFSGVSHTKTQRTRKTTSPSLPVHLTLVGCYSSEEKLIDCAHHEYTSSSTSESMDISIICGSTTSTSTTSTLINSTGSTSAKSDIVSTVSLSIAVICVSAIVVLVVVLILVFLFRQRKKQRIARWVEAVV